MADRMNVISFNETEAKREKKANVYNEFSYTENDGVESLIEIHNSKNKLMQLKNEVSDTVISIVSKYPKFTRFNEEVNWYLTVFSDRFYEICVSIESITNLMKMSILDFAKQDQSLLDDLAELNKEIYGIEPMNITEKGYPSSRDGYKG